MERGGGGKAICINGRTGVRIYPSPTLTCICNQAAAAREPTFMYAMPMGPSADGARRRIFFEETSLVARPPMSFDECKRRMEKRLGHLGVTVYKVEEEEFCYIPMGGVLPKREQRVVAFGGSLGLVHPATGYQICRALAAAGPAARAIATEVGLWVGGWELVDVHRIVWAHIRSTPCVQDSFRLTRPKNTHQHSSAAPAPPTTRTRPRAACTTACGATSSGCSGTSRCLAGSSSWPRTPAISGASLIPSSASRWRSGRCVLVWLVDGWVGLVYDDYMSCRSTPHHPNIPSHHTDTSQPHPCIHPPTHPQGFLAGWPGLPNNAAHETWLARLEFGVRLFLLAPLPLKFALAYAGVTTGGLPFFRSVTPLADLLPPFPPAEDGAAGGGGGSGAAAAAGGSAASQVESIR